MRISYCKFVNHVIEKDTRRNILQKKWMFFILNTLYIYICTHNILCMPLLHTIRN